MTFSSIRMFSVYVFALFILSVVTAEHTSPGSNRQYTNNKRSRTGRAPANSPRRFLAPSKEYGHRNKSKRALKKAKADVFKQGDSYGKKGKKESTTTAEFLYTQNQDQLHLTTVDSAISVYGGSSAAGVPLGGDLFCTYAGLCQGIGRHTLEGQGENIPGGENPVLEVLVGGPITATSFLPNGEVDVDDTPTFQFTCPSSFQTIEDSGFEYLCDCYESSSTCTMVLTPGNPATVTYDATSGCADGFFADIFLECTD